MSMVLANPNKLGQEVSLQVRDNVMSGGLRLPPDYSADNAIKAALLILPELRDSNKIPVLKSCTSDSIKNALFSMAIQGLNPDKKQCYFIAYGNKLAMTRSYFGDIAVAKQVDPQIEDVYPEVVYEGDKFEYEIKRGKIVGISHGQKIENKGNEIIAAYATVVYKDGKELSTVMTFEQIKQAWKQSNTKPVNADGTLNPNSTHAKFSEEMAKKTVTHKACKSIINSSSDANLFTQYAKKSSDEADAIESKAEIEENANAIEMEPFIDMETGEVIEVEESDPF